MTLAEAIIVTPCAGQAVSASKTRAEGSLLLKYTSCWVTPLLRPKKGGTYLSFKATGRQQLLLDATSQGARENARIGS